MKIYLIPDKLPGAPERKQPDGFVEEAFTCLVSKETDCCGHDQYFQRLFIQIVLKLDLLSGIFSFLATAWRVVYFFSLIEISATD